MAIIAKRCPENITLVVKYLFPKVLKNTFFFFTVVTAMAVWEEVRKIMQPLHKKIMQPLNYKKNFFITFRKSSLRDFLKAQATFYSISFLSSQYRYQWKPLMNFPYKVYFDQKLFCNKTSCKSQNAALRTSHWLSTVSKCSFQKYWKSIFLQ